MSRQAEARTMSVDEVVDALRQQIVDHDLPPGSKLRETALAESFGISRPRLREAFGILEDRGLIERIRNQGAVVSRLTADQVEALFDVREVLEALAVRLATQNAPKDTWDDLSYRFGEPARAALARNDINYYVEAINAFRSQTVLEARNEFLTQSLDKLYDRTRVLVRRLVLVPGRIAAALDEHERILDAMMAGEAERAEELKRANIRSARQWFSDYKKFLL
ncbi:GntR family transcriptional regulator [Nitratireductor indicus]|uniref:GntR family transcriptional regulator n=1 Tax=Nitratireductor indicus C115 TaxID=1231190 RepID=K2P7M9_9HYPH|nr:GntR family transcriptional regulator [Nitratireductor indicus]EKF43241.1 GntR family transcriptional regulator [Nitratireductor indicus C115]MDS1137794.1 GntR family transcriptional regulator [Nitratireductor indicus]SFQ54007.1 DNA-binding transcriptional regulator, GntR family [Nitratireductor indicus]